MKFFHQSIYLSIYLSTPIPLSSTGGYVNFRRVERPTDDGKVRYLPTHDERKYNTRQNKSRPTKHTNHLNFNHKSFIRALF